MTVVRLCVVRSSVPPVQVIKAIADAVSATEGCSVLDVDPGASTNRTVYTFVGSPQAVVEGALNAAHAAFTLIDMTKHKGVYTQTHTHILSLSLSLPQRALL